ncbi:hypothetical protein BH747_03150 [Enterococcus villorum]|uniref:DUF975 domain-containing protein n=3 Tax=Enterococcus villorum TaxID=112904 RepID=A0A1V8YVV9_9ENTE|nr:DUF975 family protein [Enterococcus villorum]OQO71012.1 hypothetical protein BH747_03150 [Enterococcus villorum]OQO76787.1 hypothetical protein BH744_01630 [Enterococcus villorum]
MKNRLSLSDYRKKARASLAQQWGINAWLVFLSMFIIGIIQMIFEPFFSSGSTQQQIFSFFLENFLLFAFSYSLYYIALVVVRGGRANQRLLFSVFQKEYFGPILIINLINVAINWLINALVLLPGFLVGGVNTYSKLLFSTSSGSVNFLSENALDIGFILTTLFMTFISLLIMSIIGGLFQFAAWTKFDYPELSIIQCLQYAWYLLKDRLGTYILLQLSFIGWYILGALALFFGLLWVIAYVNVTIAEFYEQARIEKTSPAEYFL